jgi:hypothetical protein
MFLLLPRGRGVGGGERHSSDCKSLGDHFGNPQSFELTSKLSYNTFIHTYVLTTVLVKFVNIDKRWVFGTYRYSQQMRRLYSAIATN